MKFKFFSVHPGDQNGEDALNSFLQNHRILSVHRRFSDRHEVGWHICVEYLHATDVVSTNKPLFDRSNKIDYREKLSEPEFARFCIMRECRKQIAQDDAVPAYAVFLDDHLAELSKHEHLSPAILKSVSGIGEKKCQKYGERFITLYQSKHHETSGKSVSTNSDLRQHPLGLLEGATG